MSWIEVWIDTYGDVVWNSIDPSANYDAEGRVEWTGRFNDGINRVRGTGDRRGFTFGSWMILK